MFIPHPHSDATHISCTSDSSAASSVLSPDTATTTATTRHPRMLRTNLTQTHTHMHHCHTNDAPHAPESTQHLSLLSWLCRPLLRPFQWMLAPSPAPSTMRTQAEITDLNSAVSGLTEERSALMSDLDSARAQLNEVCCCYPLLLLLLFVPVICAVPLHVHGGNAFCFSPLPSSLLPPHSAIVASSCLQWLTYALVFPHRCIAGIEHNCHTDSRDSAAAAAGRRTGAVRAGARTAGTGR